MYSDITLTNHLQTSSAVSVKNKVVLELNLNSSETIKAIGNYKNRPTNESPNQATAPNTAWNENESKLTSATNEWFGYTDYDVVIDGGYTDENSIPVTFRSANERQKSLMSLEDCFNRFRPRSGINKLRNFGMQKKIIPNSSFGSSTFLNPRYYAASKDDKFKYWSSYRKTDNAEYGISRFNSNLVAIIEDAAPFVIYKNLMPTNKVVIKLQTNVSNNNTLPTANADPFYSGSTPNYKSTPLAWKVQKYTGTAWVDMYSTTSDEFTGDAATTGYFQLSYGLNNAEISTTYKDTFVIVGTVSSTDALPLIQEPKQKGQAYLLKSSSTDKGTLYIYNGGISATKLDNYLQLTPSYGWYKSEESITNSQMFVTELDKTDAQSYVESSVTKYREFEYIQGLRIVASTMANNNCTFDLIELSPRLEIDITDSVASFSIKKFASDIGVSNIPVNQLLASTGEISIFDYNQVFNTNNQNSLLNIYESNVLQTTFINKGLQFKFYEIIGKVPQEFGIISNNPQPTGTTNITIKTENPHGIVQGDSVIVSGVSPVGYNGSWTAQSGTNSSTSTLVLNIGSNPGNISTIGTVTKSVPTYKDFYVPVKVLYSDGFPQYDDGSRNVSIALRDLSFYFESFLAPEIMLRNASVSFIVATLLDSIGFSNYKFLRASAISDAVIPFFMVPPDKNVMQVLQDLAVATQTTMFFDEVNNFVVMTKEYLVPTSDVRNKDVSLYGIDQGPRKANILSVNSESNDIYNDGKIVYYNRYIQKAPNDLNSLSRLDKNQIFQYQRTVFWALEASEENLQSRNEENETQTAYALTAIPLAKTLYDTIPVVQPGATNALNKIVDNIIEFGDGAYWLARYNGYFYSNGEIIKYDAIEYMVGDLGPIWITSNEEYQYYFSQINKGNKMYKTGRVRIYAEPQYNSDGTIKVDAIRKHGRGQFGTTITTHGVDDGTTEQWWEKNKNTLVTQYHQLLGNGKDTSATVLANKDIVKNKSVTSSTKIKNFLGKLSYSLKSSKLQTYDTIQSSGLVLKGPAFQTDVSAMSAICYAKKTLDSNIKYDTFGARLRFFGGQSESQDPSRLNIGSSYNIYSDIQQVYRDKTTGILKEAPSSINAKSGGIAIMTNSKGEGYYYELVALDYTDTQALTGENAGNLNPVTVNTLLFYKLKDVNNNGVLVPEKLHTAFKNILVDTGKFTGKVLRTKQTDSVYDIGISVSKNSDKSWVFALYLDNDQVALVEDKQPIINNVSENVSLFVRGSSDALFENMYAMRRFLTTEEIKTTIGVDKKQSLPIATKVFDDTKISGITGNKYSLSPLVQTGFLSKLSTSSIPETEIYYEEFGAIMRECAYFNVKFDQAYPALTSLISPVPASLGGYRVAGYSSTPYRAEFLIFNITDEPLDLAANKGYEDNVSITGVTFTKEAARDLTVDEYLTDKSTFIQPINYNPEQFKKDYTNIKNNRLLYGTKSFVIDSPYIQTADLARNLMGFLIGKLSKPRKAVGIEVFGMPIIQMGDIISLSFDTTQTLPNSVSGKNYVVYASEYTRNPDGPSTRLYLSEVT